MQRDEVIKVLEAIAPIAIGTRSIRDNGFSEQVIVELCGGNPWNNIVLRIAYSKDEVLLFAYDVYEE